MGDKDFYTNERLPDHKFELLVDGMMPGTTVHSYFHTQEAVTLSLVNLPQGASWRIVEFEVGEKRIP